MILLFASIRLCIRSAHDDNAKTLRGSDAKLKDGKRAVAEAAFQDYMLTKSMKSIAGYHLIKPEDLFWRPSNMMRIPNADFLERTKSEILGARLWRLPPKSAMTLHKHARAEEFY